MFGTDFSLTGPTKELENLQHALKFIGTVTFKRKLFRAVAKEARRLAKEEFDSSVDPWGNPWAPLKHPSWKNAYGHRILWQTGKLVGGIDSKVYDDGFRLVSKAPYTKYPQFGTKRMVRRQIFPDDELPPKWLEAFEQAALNVLEEVLDARYGP